MNKRTFYTELAYAFGILVLALGTALMERADFGMSMVVAPAYIIHLKISEYLPFFSFVTAVIYGFSLDGMMAVVALLPSEGIAVRLGLYVAGMLACTEICKIVYDSTSCVAAIFLSFIFFGFGHFEGVKWGTVVAALVNGMMIGLWTKLWERSWNFADRFALRKYFE